MTLQKTILLNHAQKSLLKSHAIKSEPDESCALLFGIHDKHTARVQEIFFTKNADKSKVSFSVSVKDLINSYSMAEEKNMQLVGIFHSHPDSEPIPSQTDRKFMRVNPVVWVIYSGRSDDFRAYFLDSDVVEVQIT